MARNVLDDDCLFYWQVGPSVIFGRNQLIGNEVNLEYCQSHAIDVFRRKSGGGCVYADKNNVMFSFITGEENVGLTFNRYINMMVLMLKRLGVNASATGRNDIVVDSRKVSGNAFYHIPGRSIVHGTMLYDTDMDNMTHSITPQGDKLKSNGVESVRQRVALLKDYVRLGIDDFKTYIKENLCDGEHALTKHDVGEIERIEHDVYASDKFIYGKDPRYAVTRKRRIEGVGDMEVHMEIKGGRIRDIRLSGDFFVIGDITGKINDSLKDVEYDRGAVCKALPDRLDDVVMNLDKDDFVNLLFNMNH